jgi:hypothetical protein
MVDAPHDVSVRQHISNSILKTFLPVNHEGQKGVLHDSAWEVLFAHGEKPLPGVAVFPFNVGPGWGERLIESVDKDAVRLSCASCSYKRNSYIPVVKGHGEDHTPVGGLHVSAIQSSQGSRMVLHDSVARSRPHENTEHRLGSRINGGIRGDDEDRVVVRASQPLAIGGELLEAGLCFPWCGARRHT